jgi:hypothetical protein
MIYSNSASHWVNKTVKWNHLEERLSPRGVKNFERVQLTGKALHALDDYTLLIVEDGTGKQHKVEIYELF